VVVAGVEVGAASADDVTTNAAIASESDLSCPTSRVRRLCKAILRDGRYGDSLVRVRFDELGAASPPSVLAKSAYVIVRAKTRYGW
jgi:hypothetical protein